MQWLRHISLRKQAESKSSLDDALKQVAATENVFDELRQALHAITVDVREKAKPSEKKNGIKTPLAMHVNGTALAPPRSDEDVRRSEDDRQSEDDGRSQEPGIEK